MEDDEFSIEALEALNQESISLPPVADVKSKYKVRKTEPSCVAQFR